VMHQMSMSLYRLLASLGRTQVMANMLGTEALIAIFILGGFIISKGRMTAIKFLRALESSQVLTILRHEHN